MYISDGNKARIKRLLKALKNPEATVIGSENPKQSRYVEISERDSKELIEALEMANMQP